MQLCLSFGGRKWVGHTVYNEILASLAFEGNQVSILRAY
jgi:hypothetical protein